MARRRRKMFKYSGVTKHASGPTETAEEKMDNARKSVAKQRGLTVNQLKIAGARLDHNEASACEGNLNTGSGSASCMAQGGGGFQFGTIIW